MPSLKNVLSISLASSVDPGAMETRHDAIDRKPHGIKRTGSRVLHKLVINYPDLVANCLGTSIRYDAATILAHGQSSLVIAGQDNNVEKLIHATRAMT